MKLITAVSRKGAKTQRKHLKKLCALAPLREMSGKLHMIEEDMTWSSQDGVKWTTARTGSTAAKPAPPTSKQMMSGL
jgi:hypothetical protein